MKEYRHLTSLSLAFNQITARGAILISEAMEAGASFVDLNLSSNFLGDRGVSAILGVLASSKSCSVRNLNLHECGVGGDGCAVSWGAWDGNEDGDGPRTGVGG